MREAFRRAQRLAAILLGVAAPADAAVFVVNVTSDSALGNPANCVALQRDPPPTTLPSGPCNLRDAVAAANDNNGADEIVFDIPISSTIALANPLVLDDTDGVSLNALPLPGLGQQLLTGLIIQGPAGTDALAVQVDAGSAGFRNLTISRGDVQVADNASVVFEQTTGSVTFAQDVTGDGSLQKEGAGTVILTGKNDFTGGIEIGQGTLQGDTFSLPGGTALAPSDVEDDGKIVFDQDPAEQGPVGDDPGDPAQADDLPENFFGEISGNGSLELIGGGRLNLLGANTYGGGTTITDGTLIGFAGTGASLQGDIVDNDELIFLQAADGTFADDITGSGRVEKQGIGILTLTGANRFSGGLEITQGVVIGDTDAIPGNVAIGSGAQLVFDQAADGTHSGNITGGGGAPPGGFTLIKRGAGTLSLTGDNTFTGDTSLEAGSLQVTSQSLRGDVVMAAAAGPLIFSQGFDGSYTGVITSVAGDSAAVDLFKRGSGTLSLLASPAFQADDATAIEGGSLFIGAGTTLPGAVDVRSGTLAGIGAVGGAVTAQSGARIAPGPVGGTAFGTLGVGSVSFLSGSVFEVQVDDGAADLLSVGDTANIAAGAALDVTFPEIAPGADFTQVILTAANGVTGAFALDQELCFFTVSAVNGPNSVSVDVTPKEDAQLADCANTRNQRAVATALEEAFALAPDGDLDAVFSALGALPADEVPGALDQMAGEQLTGFPTTRLAIADRFTTSLHERIRGVAWSDSETLLAEQTRESGPVLAGDAVLQRALPGVVQGFAQSDSFPTWFGAQSMSTVLDSGTSFQPLQGEHGLGGWIDGYGIFGALDGDADASDLDYIVGGFSLGVDYLVAKNVLIGAAGGYAYSTLDYDHLSGDATSNTGQGALYAGYVTPWLRLGASGRFGYSAMETRRDIDFMNRSADGDFSGWDGGARAEAALDLFKLGFVEVQPLASFSYTHVEQDSFDESGADSLDLDVDEQTLDSLVSGVGARFHGLLQMDETLWFHPELHATWLHEFGDRERELDARIGGTPGAVFTVRGAKPSADVGALGVRWTVVSAGRLHVFADYDVALSSTLIQQGASAGFKVVW
ncbi:MAG TPA: autotransporter domain-containing protein [Myxococcota bacterium]|nr:autotransporter domain-containing protein [Myxococcota bacterium]